jgi:hypothetical protein
MERTKRTQRIKPGSSPEKMVRICQANLKGCDDVEGTLLEWAGRTGGKGPERLFYEEIATQPKWNVRSKL